MTIVPILLILLALFPAKIDEPRYKGSFVSENGKYEFKQTTMYVQPVTWALFEKGKDKPLYQLTGQFGDRTVFVSNDGVTLVVIDDWSARPHSKDLDVLLFYQNGTLKKKYLLGDLLKDQSNVSASVSHFWWMITEKHFVRDGKLTFKTLELVDYEIDCLTGEIISQKLDPLIDAKTIYAYGEVSLVSEQTYEMRVCHRAYGEIPASGKFRFTDEGNKLAKFHKQLPRHMTLIIKDNSCAEVMSYWLNSCNYRSKESVQRKK